MRVAVRLALGMLPLVSFAVSICSFWKLSNLNRGSRQAAVGTRKIFPAKLNWGTHHFGPQPLSTNAKIRLMSAFWPKWAFHYVAFDVFPGVKRT